jgi:hypothetical protein
VAGCTDVASDGVQQELKSLRAELRNTMAACIQALKFGAVENRQLELNLLAHNLQHRDMDIKYLSPIPRLPAGIVKAKFTHILLVGLGQERNLKRLEFLPLSMTSTTAAAKCADLSRRVRMQQFRDTAAIQRRQPKILYCRGRIDFSLCWNMML